MCDLTEKYDCLYGVVQLPINAVLLYESVDVPPSADGQYRVVCVTLHGSDARQITKLLPGLHGHDYDYAIIPVDPENLQPFTWCLETEPAD